MKTAPATRFRVPTTGSHPIQREQITKTQLLAQDPEAARYLDELKASTVGGLEGELKKTEEGARCDREMNGHLALIAGATGLALGFIAGPAAGFGAGAFGIVFGIMSAMEAFRVNDAERERQSLNELADRTLESLVAGPNGTLTDLTVKAR